MTEHDIQNAIRLELSARGYTVFRANVGKFKMADGRFFDVGLPKGFSDLFCVKNGKIYFLEVKTETGIPNQDQINFIRRMKDKGCKAGVVHSIAEAIKLTEEEK